jgi:putative flippase GtrA
MMAGLKSALGDLPTAGRTRVPYFELLRQPASFAAIGIVSTLAYAVLYTTLRTATPAPAANAFALVATTIANTAANRRITFRVRGRSGLVQDHLAGLGAFVVSLAITSASLGLLHLAVVRPNLLGELAVLVAGSAVATMVRFLVLRSWLERHTRVLLVTKSAGE